MNEFMRTAVISHPRRQKVFVLSPADFLSCMRGEKRIFGLPGDAEPLSFSCLPGRREVGLLVHSSKFEIVAGDQRVPCVFATMERVK